ncbi:hypothetical protein D3C81_1344840 [compost metagenome]
MRLLLVRKPDRVRYSAYPQHPVVLPRQHTQGYLWITHLRDAANLGTDPALRLALPFIRLPPSVFEISDLEGASLQIQQRCQLAKLIQCRRSKQNI